MTSLSSDRKWAFLSFDETAGGRRVQLFISGPAAGGLLARILPKAVLGISVRCLCQRLNAQSFAVFGYADLRDEVAGRLHAHSPSPPVCSFSSFYINLQLRDSLFAKNTVQEVLRKAHNIWEQSIRKKAR